MSDKLVTLVNPNFVFPPVAPYALDVLGTSLEANGFDVEVVDLTFHRVDWRTIVREYFVARDPLLVGVTVRNTDTIYAQQQRVFLDSHKNVINAISLHASAPIVCGGVGFSSMPFALTDYFDIPFAVKGPGETILVRLARALQLGTPPWHIPGLVINHGHPVNERSGLRVSPSQICRVPFFGEERGRDRRDKLADDDAETVNTTTAYTRRSSTPYKVDNLKYYRASGLGNLLTKNGCVFNCTHCVEPDAKGVTFSRRSARAVVDELESLTAQGIYDVHTTDSEFNLAIAHSKAVLKEAIRRKDGDPRSPLHKLRLWIYAQPAPFDEELIALLVAAGCGGINLAPDHVHNDILDGWKVTDRGSRFYTFDDVRRVCSLANSYEIPIMVEVLLGMPGETADSLRECVRSTLNLHATVTGYSLGIRVFPYSPLGIWLAEECGGTQAVPGLQSDTARAPIVLRPQAMCSSLVEYERQFMFDDQGQFRPVYYLSPDLPQAPEGVNPTHERWASSIELLRQLVPPQDLYRVMLPTLPGLTPDDNNYADNPFLLRLTELGATGAFWSHWPKRAEIMQQPPAAGPAAHGPLAS